MDEMVIVDQGGAARGEPGPGERGHPVRPRAGRHRQRRAGRCPAGQGSRRGPGQDRRRGRLPRGGVRRGPGRDTRVGAARHHPADGAAARRRLRGDARPRRAGAARHDRRADHEAKRLEGAGAALLDFTNSGPVAGPAVTESVGIPVIGGAGGGPWLDGRVRMAHAAIGYAAKTLGDTPDSYAHVAQITLDTFAALADDVRAGRHIRATAAPEPGRAGGMPMPTAVIDGIATHYEISGRRPAAAAVLTGRVQRDPGQLDVVQHLRAARAGWTTSPSPTPACCSTGASQARPAAASSGSPGRTTRPRARACSTISASPAPT